MSDNNSEKHGNVWRSTSRKQPLSSRPFDAIEWRSFSGGGSVHPTASKKTAVKHEVKNGKPSSKWRTHEMREGSEAEGEEILWATEDTGVGVFDAQGNFKFISEDIGNSEKRCMVTSTTEWYYRDPKGNIQGPFLSTQMLDWYNRGFFPETLPLNIKGNGDVWESLAAWKVKLNGKCPFEPSSAPGFDISESSTSSSNALTSKPNIQSPDRHVQNADRTDKSAAESKQLFNNEDPIVNVPVRRVTSPISRSSVASPKTSPTMTQSSESLEPAKIDEVEKQRKFLEGLMRKNKSIEASMKSISLQDMMADEAVNLKAKYDNSNNAWKSFKPATSTPKEARKERSQVQEQPVVAKSEGPKSFADLLAPSISKPQSTAASTSNSTSNSSISSTAPKIMSSPANSSSPQAYNALPSHSAQASSAQGNSTNNQSDNLADWMKSKLKPVEKTIDAHLLHHLLSECRSAEDAAILLRDNLSNLHDFDHRQFSREYLKKRFGKHVDSKVIAIVSPKPVDNRDERVELEFMTVSRKSKK